jgi:hypothetical protein
MIKSLVFISLGLLVSSSSFAASTELQCTEANPGRVEKELKITQNENSKATVVYTWSRLRIDFEGTYRLARDSRFSKVYRFELTSSESRESAQLDVSWHKKTEGDPGFYGIEAFLNLNNKEIAFICNVVPA